MIHDCYGAMSAWRYLLMNSLGFFWAPLLLSWCYVGAAVPSYKLFGVPLGSFGVPWARMEYMRVYPIGAHAPQIADLFLAYLRFKVAVIEKRIGRDMASMRARIGIPRFILTVDYYTTQFKR